LLSGNNPLSATPNTNHENERTFCLNNKQLKGKNRQTAQLNASKTEQAGWLT